MPIARRHGSGRWRGAAWGANGICGDYRYRVRRGRSAKWPAHIGGNGTAGEWGHNPLPWMDDDELRYREEIPCYCGKQGCIENLYFRYGILPRITSV